MKHLNLTMWLALAVMLLFAAPKPAAAVSEPVGRHALLIGISNYSAYNHTGLFPNIDCERDVQVVEQALISTFKFRPNSDEIVTLTSGGAAGVPSHPEQTTRKAILSAFDALVSETKPGDIVFIHFSCHGDQVLDPTEPGGLDSTIVPSDYKDDFPPEHKTEANSNEIAGKTILSYIHKLQSALTVDGKVHGQIVLGFDSCHSESAARGLAPAVKRGSSFQEYVDWYRSNHPDYGSSPAVQTIYAGVESSDAAAVAQDTVGGVLQRSIASGSAWQDLTGSGYVVISACQNDASAYETSTVPPMGRLSVCLAQVLAQAGPDTTYQEVFDRINAMFHAKYDDQFPQLDGDPNTTLFGGTASPPPASIPTFYKATGDLEIEAGSLQDMTDGSTFALYPKDAPQTPGQEVADAKIVGEIGLTTARLTVTKQLKPFSPPDELGAVETLHVYSTQPLSVDPNSVRRADPADAAAILRRIEGLVRTSATAADIELARVPAASGARGPAVLALIQTSSNKALKTIDAANGDIPDQIYTALDNEEKYRYACQLGDGQGAQTGAGAVRMRIMPVTTGKDSAGRTVITGEDQTPAQSLKIPQSFVIQLQNTTGAPMHLALLDITGAHKVKVVWAASPGEHEDDSVLNPTANGQWATLWRLGEDTTTPDIFDATSPDSDEILKLIATADYADFSSLATRGPTTPIEELVAPAVRTRDIGEEGSDSTTVAVPPKSWYVASVGIRIQ